jgi:hypothetical protein
VLDDPDFAQRLVDGGLRAAARLTVQRHADAIEAVYERLLRPAHGALASTMRLPGPKSVD